MAELICTACGNSVSDAMAFCPACGNSLNAENDAAADVKQKKDAASRSDLQDEQVPGEKLQDPIFNTTAAACDGKLEDEEPHDKVTPTLSEQSSSPQGPSLQKRKEGFSRIPRKIKIVTGCVVAVLLAVWLLFSTHILCFHEWADATCEEPITCLICGKTQEGTEVGHSWVEATCEDAMYCSRCGETQGDPLGHDVADWKVIRKATCSEEGLQEGTCSHCGELIEQDLDTLDHTAGKWETKKNWKISSDGSVTPGKLVKKCTVCGEVLKTKEYEPSRKEIKQTFKSQCKSVSYEDLARDSDEWEGVKVKFTGKIMQVVDDDSLVNTYLVYMTRGSYGIWDDIAYVTVTAEYLDERLLEDDVVTFYGEAAGTTDYTTALGVSKTVPDIAVEYVD